MLVQFMTPGLKWPSTGAYQFFTGKSLKIFLSKTTRPRPFILGMLHHLIALYQVCLMYGPRATNAPATGHCGFLIGTSLKKIFFSETVRLRHIIFGMHLCLIELYQEYLNGVLWAQIPPPWDFAVFYRKMFKKILYLIP